MNPEHLVLLKRSWIIAGPTASGKSDLAMALASRVGGEIVAVDSMTLFRGMDIGTAKPTLADRQAIPHHLIDILAPSDSSNVADWLEKCHKAMESILNRGRIPILTGGTGLYWKALFFGLPHHPPGNPVVREKWVQMVKSKGNLAIHQILSQVDPVSGSRIPPTDLKRMVRALEVWEVTGSPISANRPDWGESFNERPQSPARWVWLKWPRHVLWARIADRVARMFELGWEAEVDLLEKNGGFGPQSGAAIGYKAIRTGRLESTGRAEILRRVGMETRQYAKRQETWLRSLTAIEPITLDGQPTLDGLLETLGLY